ncbi:hypothetical protein KQ693_10345 [Thermus sp. PS18]|uniref:hypothetical protein n=1 Tax=Thermus sp. PS18 TaxID=2849039 RepID=UPI0022654BF4|nr:hypothetical protein [Thermus sp. PS18]UZX15015.1 hypothetical protein KQ693_10345 [Thermus sp. PS18]
MKDFGEFLAEVGLLLRRRARGMPVYLGITAQGRPYAPGLGLMEEAVRVPGGLVWFRREGERVYFMWQPLGEVAWSHGKPLPW